MEVQAMEVCMMHRKIFRNSGAHGMLIKIAGFQWDLKHPGAVFPDY